MPEADGPNLYYGGQAVMEGVMVRGPRHMAIACRAPDGTIVTRSETLPGVMAGRLRRLPVVRGVIVLYETLALGMRALTWSSQVAAGRPDAPINGRQLAVSLAFTMSLAAAIFFAAPVLLTGWIAEAFGVSEIVEVLLEGLVRLAMLVGYVWLIGRVPDIQRVFAYHGAEHRTIHAYEHGQPLTPEGVRAFPNAHPRCGTAFLLTVMLIALVVFLLLGTPPVWVRVIERIALVPVIAALAYEVLRLGQRFGEAPVVRVLYAPNLWLQRFTTRDPDDAQIEVAIVALEATLALDGIAPAEKGLADEPVT